LTTLTYRTPQGVTAPRCLRPTAVSIVETSPLSSAFTCGYLRSPLYSTVLLNLNFFLVFLVHAFMVLFFSVIFYSIFTSIAFRQRFALTEISKYTTVINNIGRFDYLGIMMILLSNLFALSLPLFFCCKLLDRTFNFKNKWISPIITIGAHIAFLFFLSQYYATIENLLLKYGAILFFSLGNLLPLFMPLLARKKRKIVNANFTLLKENANE
jgi:hypothetical protein